MREKIGLMDSNLDIVFKMSEGNPGAITVLMKLLQKENSLINILTLDDMNIRGWQIWVGYKDFCEYDIDKFIEAIENREDRMILVINGEAIKGNLSVRVVKGGASFNKKREMSKK